MAKIVLFINRLIIGGPSNQVIDLYKHLILNNEVKVVFGKPNKKEVLDLRFKQLNPNDFIELDSLGGKFQTFKLLISYRKVKRIIQDFKPDIVHTHTTIPGIIGRIAAHKLGVKTIIHTYHGFLFQNYFGSFTTFFYRKIEQFLNKFTHKIIVLSELQRLELSKNVKIINQEKISIIPLGIDLEFDEVKNNLSNTSLRNKYSINDKTFVFASIGRLTAIKNQTLFIDALAKIKERNLNFKAFIVGDGPDFEMLKQKAQNLNLRISTSEREDKNADLIFTSWWHDLSSFFPVVDAVVLTSKSEGTPYVLLEAQFFGKAVISTNVGGVQDIVKQDETAFIIPSNNLESLVFAMEKLLLNRELCKTMGEKGKLHIQANFSLKNMLDKTSSLYFKQQE